MKINFRKLKVLDFDGNPVTNGTEPGFFDISKSLGNQIYGKTADIGELDLAREIYHSGEVEVTEQHAGVLLEYIRTGFLAAVQVAICPVLESIINHNQ